MRITIVGLGVLGTSLGLGLKSATTDIPVTGHDSDPVRVSRAKRLGAIDGSHWNLISACREADLIVLDLPFAEVAPTLAALREDLKEGAVIVDTVPLKVPVLEVARQTLPAGTAFIGGHVVAPALGLGQPEPSAELLRGARFLLVIPEEVPAEAADVAANFATAVGATPHFVDAHEHDGLAAATAQLPHLGALALANAIEGAPGGRERPEFAGAELTALAALIGDEAAQPAAMLLSNGANLLPLLDGCIAELRTLRVLLAGEDAEGLAARVAAAHAAAAHWAGQGEEGAGRPVTTSIWRSMLFGGRERGQGRPRG